MRAGAGVIVALLLLLASPLFMSVSLAGKVSEVRGTGFRSSAPDDSWEVRAEEATSPDGQTYHLSKVILRLREPIGEGTLLVAMAPRGLLRSGTLTLKGIVKIAIYQETDGYKYTKVEGTMREMSLDFQVRRLTGRSPLLKEYDMRGKLIRVIMGTGVIMDLRTGRTRISGGLTISYGGSDR